MAPGFIDIKTHSDFTLPINPKAESKVRQGVTTEIIGHCGFSVAPVLPGKAQLLADYLSGGAPWLPFREMRFPEYLDTFPGGRGQHRDAGRPQHLAADGDGARRPRAAPGRARRDDRAVGGGARAPARSACRRASSRRPAASPSPSEMLAFGPVLQAPQRRLFHPYPRRIRTRCSRRSRRRSISPAPARVHVEIVHLKCSGIDNWGKAAQILAMIDAARAEGCDIDCDAYPYAAGANPLKNLLPPWVQVGGLEAMLARLALPETRARIRGRDRPRRAQQLGPHPVLGGGADLGVAAPAAARRRDRSPRSPRRAAATRSTSSAIT